MTDTMLFGILKMPFEMAMKDEISRLQYYARVQELVGRFEAQQQAEPVQEPYESPYNPTPVEYQYHYPNGLWRCSNGEVINGLQPDRARSLYALKDNT